MRLPSPICLALPALMVLLLSCLPGGCGCGGHTQQGAPIQGNSPASAAAPLNQRSPADAARPDILDQLSFSGSLPPGPGQHSAALEVAGLQRQVELLVPEKRPARPPLLITLHGTNGDPKHMISSSAADQLARERGVVVASPAARYMQDGDWDNHSGSETYWETYPNVDPEKNPDLLLLRAIIQAARQAYGIDTRRVYLLGHSNGGFFAVLAAAALPDRIAAFAANSSGLVRCPQTGSCRFKGQGSSCADLRRQPGYCSCAGEAKPAQLAERGRKVPGYLSHASDDSVVSVYYTCELARQMEELGYPFEVRIHRDGEHSMPHPYAEQAWDFFEEHTL